MSETATATAPTTFDPTAFNPHAPDFLRDPYPTYAQFRKHAPVSFVKQYNAHWVFRYEDVKTVLTDSEDYSSLRFAKHRSDMPDAPRPGPFAVLGAMPDGIFFLDPPRHGQVRTPLDRFLEQSSGDATAITATIATALLTDAKSSRIFELMNSFALALPARVVLTILGVPEAHWGGILQWVAGVEAAHDITQSPGVQGMGGTMAMALNAYFQGLIRGTATAGCPFHAEPGRVLSKAVAEGMGPSPAMSAEDIQATGVNLAVAGFLSTSFLIGTGVLNLLGRRPDGTLDPRYGHDSTPLPIDVLRSRPELMVSAVEEMLRRDSPFQLTDRFVVNHDTELGGVQLKVGDQIGVVIASANRDETVFPDPDYFDITRYAAHPTAGNGATPAAAPHLAFGAGIHACYGGPLVDKIAPVAFATMLKEMPSIRLAGTPQWKADPYLRSPTSLPLAFG